MTSDDLEFFEAHLGAEHISTHPDRKSDIHQKKQVFLVVFLDRTLYMHVNVVNELLTLRLSCS